jgi:predicted RNA-binding Zn ribbon-like protein
MSLDEARTAMTAATDTFEFDLSAGQLCLDFTNTLNGSRAQPRERLTSYPHLVAWGRQAGLLTVAEERRLLRAATENVSAAAATLDRAIALREAIFRSVAAIVHDQPPAADDLALLNAELTAAMSRLRVVQTPDGLVWDWQTDGPALDRMLWPVARSAADLLTSDDLDRIRLCASEECDWLFMDMSRNRSRRWCSMSDCGNRAKARRHYQRHHGATRSM